MGAANPPLSFFTPYETLVVDPTVAVCCMRSMPSVHHVYAFYCSWRGPWNHDPLMPLILFSILLALLNYYIPPLPMSLTPCVLYAYHHLYRDTADRGNVIGLVSPQRVSPDTWYHLGGNGYVGSPSV